MSCSVRLFPEAEARHHGGDFFLVVVFAVGNNDVRGGEDFEDWGCEQDNGLEDSPVKNGSNLGERGLDSETQKWAE